MSRRQWFAEGKPAEVMASLTKMIGECGAKSFEFGYEVDGPDPDRDAQPGEEVTWYAEITFSDGDSERTEVRSTDHHAGPVLATVELLSRLGANVAMLDMRTS